jgi:hypothetical protein
LYRAVDEEPMKPRRSGASPILHRRVAISDPMRLPAVGCVVVLLTGLLSPPAAAQTPTPPPAAGPSPPSAAPPAATARLRVALDCDDCFDDFVREEIAWVDFVRRPEDAEVQVLSSRQDTGGGGRQVVLRFIGHGRFDGVDKELRVTSEPGAPEDERRRAILDVIRIGLLDYLARVGETTNLAVEVDGGTAPAAAGGRDDPWNLWVFSVHGDGRREGEASSQEWHASFDTTADRVTDRWKLSFGLHVDEQGEQYDIDDDDGGEAEVLHVRRHERSFEWFVARSVNSHVSLGLDGDFERSTYDNIRHRVRLAPAIEFNLFPYAQYATRQLRIEYSIGARHAAYDEPTIFGKTEETLGRHELSATLDQRQAWGELNARIEWSQYLHDLSLTHLDVRGGASLRVARGLSLDADVEASRIRDQISLPQRGATPEEVLLELRELQSGYHFEVSVGITYTFGSIFNAIVNPRFGT